MVTDDTVRLKLQDKLFTPYGKSVTLQTRTAAYNDRGEIDSPTYVDSTITIVPYNIISARQTYEAFGAMEEGEQDAAVPYTVTVAVDDIIVIDSINWLIKAVETNLLPENVVTIVRLVKQQN